MRHNLTHAIFPVYRWLILIYERTKTSSDEFPSPTATPHLPPAPPSHPSPHGSKNQQELLQTFCGQRFSFDEEHFSNAFALNVFKKLVITTGFPWLCCLLDASVRPPQDGGHRSSRGRGRGRTKSNLQRVYRKRVSYRSYEDANAIPNVKQIFRWKSPSTEYLK